jgi:hypothetical protein
MTCICTSITCSIHSSETINYKNKNHQNTFSVPLTTKYPPGSKGHSPTKSSKKHELKKNIHIKTLILRIKRGVHIYLDLIENQKSFFYLLILNLRIKELILFICA